MKRIVLIVSLFALSSSVSAQINFTDNFDDGNIEDWTMFDAIGFATGEPFASVTFPDGGLRIDSPATPDPALGPGTVILGRPDLVFSDFDMSIDVLKDDGSPGSIYAMSARAQAPFFAYLLGAGKVKSNTPGFPPEAEGKTVFFMSRVDGPTAGEALGIAFVDVPEGSGLKLAFRGVGNKLTGEIFSSGELSTALATLTAEDATYPFGFAELVATVGVPEGSPPIFEAFTDVTLDNFSLVATQVPEPSSAMVAFIPIGLLSLLRRRRIHRPTQSQTS